MKWCSECGTSRAGNQIHKATDVVDIVRSNEVDVVDVVRSNEVDVVDVVRSNEVVVAGEQPDLPLYAVPQMPTLSLYARVYEPRLKGLPRDIAWGKRFLKEHHCYNKQYQKVKLNPRIVHEWFKPVTNEFVDEFLNNSSLLRWNLAFVKRISKCCAHKRKKNKKDEDEKNMIFDIKLPNEGLKLH